MHMLDALSFCLRDKRVSPRHLRRSALQRLSRVPCHFDRFGEKNSTHPSYMQVFFYIQFSAGVSPADFHRHRFIYFHCRKYLLFADSFLNGMSRCDISGSQNNALAVSSRLKEAGIGPCRTAGENRFHSAGTQRLFCRFYHFGIRVCAEWNVRQGGSVEYIPDFCFKPGGFPVQLIDQFLQFFINLCNRFTGQAYT